MLYPIRFKPILKPRIWGGDRFAPKGRRAGSTNSMQKENIGEKWAISGITGDVSVVSNGFLKSNDLEEITEVYMGDLVGDKVYDTYGTEFPVLVKFIDTRDALSIQVHPDDDLAAARHGSRGKTEMWYIMDCEPGAYVYVGFNRPVTQQEYLAALTGGRLTDILHRYEVRKGDIYYIPSGTIHAIGPGVMLAEIHETSDITYRIYDWGRVDTNGNPRQLHTAEATDAIDFEYGKNYLLKVSATPNTANEIISTPFFTACEMIIDGEMRRDYYALDSFVACVCTEGELRVATQGGEELLKAQDTVLLPAETEEAVITGRGTMLEIFMK